MGPTQAIIEALTSNTTWGRVLVRALAESEREIEVLTMKLTRALDTISRTKPAKTRRRATQPERDGRGK